MKRIASSAAVIALVAASLMLSTSTATAYQQSSPSATLLTFPSGLTVAVSSANAGSSTITLTPENTNDLGGVTTYAPVLASSTGVHYAIDNPVIQNDAYVDAGSVTFAFSHPVVNPRIHVVRAGGIITTGPTTYTASNSFELAAGSWQALTGFTNYATSTTAVTAPAGAVNYATGTTRCVPAATAGSIPFACGTLALDGTVSSATIDLSYYRVVRAAPDPGGTYAGQGGFTITVDESLSGTATGDLPLPASYGASSNVVTDLRLGSAVSSDQQTTLTGGAPVFQAQKTGVDGVATLPVLNPGEGSTFTAAVSGASAPAFAYAWIDVNRDGAYGAEERVPGVVSGGTATFTVPQALMASAVAGSTFLRVRTGYTDAQASAPTGFSDSGETEDYSVEVLAPTAPVITAPAAGSATSDSTPTFTGTGDDGDDITLTDGDGDVVCTTTVVDGAWSCTPTTPLPEGANTVTPTATDAAGNTTEGAPVTFAVDTAAPTAPVITGPADGALVTDSTPTFTGTGDDGDTVTLTDDDGTVICTTTVTDGTWSCTPTTPLPEGTNTITPTATDPAGNATAGDPIEVDVDTVAPTAPVLTGPADGAVVTDATPTFTGTGDDGDTITVTDGDGTVLCTTTVVDGAWSCTPTDPLPEGVNTITPTATDPAGNSTAGDPIDVTVDTVAPTAPVLTGPADGAVVTDATPTFTGTGDDGDTITVTDGDGTVLCTTTVVDGTWSCTPTDPLPEGTNTVTPTATDPAGNTTDGIPVEFTVDTVAPSAPVITGPADGDVVTDATPTFTGTGDDGDTITVTDGDGTVLCTTTVVDGAWSCTPTDPLPEGTSTITPTATDPAGNSTAGSPIDVTVDTVAPSAPVITGPADGDVVTDATPTFTGTGDDGDTITVTDGDGTVLCTTTVVDGEWSCTPTDPLPEGTNTITPTATDPAGNTTDGTPIELTVDTVAPSAPVITGPADGDVVDTATPAFTGTGDDGDTITVTDGDGAVLCTTTVVDGAWSCTPTAPLPEGTNTVTPTATDPAGNTTDGDPIEFTVDTVAPSAPVITGPADGEVVTDATPTFTGTGDDGDTITVTDGDGTVLCTTTVVDGAWSCTPTTPLPEGTNTVTPTATDPAGNSTPGAAVTFAVDTVAPSAPVITGPADGAVVTDASPTFTGTGDDGDTITVTDGDGAVLCTTTVVDGTWSCTPTDPLPEGTNTITPTATDPAGNTTTGDPIDVTVDTVAPSAPVITGPADGAVLDTATPAFTGTGDDGDTITLTDDDGTVICTTTVTDGEWSCTPATPLPEGPSTITPTATDPAGNTTEGDPIGLTVDTVAPTAPVITGPADGAVVTDATPTFTGTGDDGDTITLTDGDGDVVCTATVVDGAWSCTPTTPLPEGPSTITPTATDPAGNTTDGDPIGLTVDTVAPTAPVITGPADGAVVTDATPTFTGTGDEGDTITLTDDDGTVICTATVVDGAWSCTPTTPLPEGSNTITPTATDPAGNTTDGDPIGLTVDTGAPTPPVLTGPADGEAIDTATPTFSGTGDEGDTITVTDGDGNVLCTTTVVDGAWSCTPTDPLPEGTNTITPTATDPAGNSTAGDPVDVTVDTVAPAAPTDLVCAVNADGTVTCGGSGEPGGTAIIRDDDGNEVCRAAISASGAFSCTSDAPVDVYPLAVTVEDPAGNESPPTAPPIPPTIVGPDAGSTTNDPTPEISGTGVPGDTVEVRDPSGAVICSATVDPDGAWACTPSDPLPEGGTTLVPVAIGDDGGEFAGPPIDVVVDTVPPAPVVNPICVQNANLTITCSGTGEPGTTVVVMAPDGSELCRTAVVMPEWSCTSSGPADPDEVSIMVIDAAGNVSTPTIAPVTPYVPQASGGGGGTLGTTGADSSAAIALGILLLVMGGAALLRSRRWAPVNSDSSTP